MSAKMTVEQGEAAFDDLVARAEAGKCIEITRDGRTIAYFGPVAKEAQDEFVLCTFAWPTPRYPED